MFPSNSRQTNKLGISGLVCESHIKHILMKVSTLSILLCSAVALFFVYTTTTGVAHVGHAEETAPTAAADAPTHGEWWVDFEQAQAAARAQNKPMLLDFTGSDWCGWCIKLDKEVFSQPEFKAYAAESLVLVELDFPKRKPQSAAIQAQNEALAEKYGIRGFPTILLLTPEGELIERTGYMRGGAATYVAHLKAILADV